MGQLNLSEEGKLGLMHKSLTKLLKKQISIREKAIAKIKEELADEVEAMTETLVEIQEDAELAFVTVNVDELTSVDSRKAYAQDLNYAFDRALDKVEAQEKAIEEVKEKANATIEAKETEIKRFELKLSKIA